MFEFDSNFPSAVRRPIAIAKPGDPVADAIDAIAAGEMVIVVDDDDRENEGDLVLAASKATPEQIAFMIRHTSGILCTAMGRERARALQLAPMAADNDAPLQTAFTVSVDCKAGLTTGISARERTATIHALADPNSAPADFVRPGHMFPLVARAGGVLERTGHTEATVDLVRLAGLAPVGVLAELVNDDGTVQRMPDLCAFAQTHNLRMVAINDLIAYRQRHERLVSRTSEFNADTHIGTAKVMTFTSPFDSVEQLALVFGTIDPTRPTPVRIQRQQVFADIFGSSGKQSGDGLTAALEHFRHEGRGVLIYLRDRTLDPAQSGKEGDDTSEDRRWRDWREIGFAAQVLRDLGVDAIRLLTTGRDHYVGLVELGLNVTELQINDSRAPFFDDFSHSPGPRDLSLNGAAYVSAITYAPPHPRVHA